MAISSPEPTRAYGASAQTPEPPTVAFEQEPTKVVDAELASRGLSPDTLISDRYRIVRRLGEGGMGVVYEAEHVHMRKRVAIKVLLTEVSNDPEVIARFEREAIAVSALEHENIARATDFGRMQDGSFFLVLEYVAGRTLRSVLEGGALEPRRALSIMQGVAAAMAAAHARGVVHRDLKPENIMLIERNGQADFVKVLDFGVAKVDDASSSPSSALTQLGAILGTPDYMAPEQALGRPVDARSDLYSLGIILYEMLTGTCPFKGGAITLLRQHILDEAPPLPDAVGASVDPQLHAIVRRLLQKRPEDRYSSALELMAGLGEFARTTLPGRASATSLEGTATTATQPGIARPVRGIGERIDGAATRLVGVVERLGALAKDPTPLQRHVTPLRVAVGAVIAAVLWVSFVALVVGSLREATSSSRTTAVVSTEPARTAPPLRPSAVVSTATASASALPPPPRKETLRWRR